MYTLKIKALNCEDMEVYTNLHKSEANNIIRFYDNNHGIDFMNLEEETEFYEEGQ